MVELSPTDLISIISLVGAAIAGWALHEFSSINKKYDNLSENINDYIKQTDEKITGIKVDIGKIQTSVSNMEEMMKHGR